VDSTDLRIESAAMWSRGIHRLVLAALLGCAPSSSAAELTILRDAQDRITRMEWSTGGSRRSIMLYVVEAEPGGDVRDAPARLLWEADLGGAIVRAQGVPVAQAAAVLRDPATGVPQPTQPMDGPRPSEEVLAAAVASRSISAFFLSFQCTAIAFPDPDPLLANQCAALWLSGGAPHHLLLAPTRSTAYLAVPEARTPLDEALLGCGSLYGTSCSEDGIDLWWAHAGVLHQRFPGFAQPLPPDGDSEVLQSVAWNWFTGHALATGVEPGTGDAAACRFDAPDGVPGSRDRAAVLPRPACARRRADQRPTASLGLGAGNHLPARACLDRRRPFSRAAAVPDGATPCPRVGAFRGERRGTGRRHLLDSRGELRPRRHRRDRRALRGRATPASPSLSLIFGRRSASLARAIVAMLRQPH
jgi:hypothetical protein